MPIAVLAAVRTAAAGRGECTVSQGVSAVRMKRCTGANAESMERPIMHWLVVGVLECGHCSRCCMAIERDHCESARHPASSRRSAVGMRSSAHATPTHIPPTLTLHTLRISPLDLTDGTTKEQRNSERPRVSHQPLITHTLTTLKDQLQCFITVGA